MYPQFIRLLATEEAQEHATVRAERQLGLSYGILQLPVVPAVHTARGPALHVQSLLMEQMELMELMELMEQMELMELMELMEQMEQMEQIVRTDLLLIFYTHSIIHSKPAVKALRTAPDEYANE